MEKEKDVASSANLQNDMPNTSRVKFDLNLLYENETENDEWPMESIVGVDVLASAKLMEKALATQDCYSQKPFFRELLAPGFRLLSDMEPPSTAASHKHTIDDIDSQFGMSASQLGQLYVLADQAQHPASPVCLCATAHPVTTLKRTLSVKQSHLNDPTVNSPSPIREYKGGESSTDDTCAAVQNFQPNTAGTYSRRKAEKERQSTPTRRSLFEIPDSLSSIGDEAMAIGSDSDNDMFFGSALSLNVFPGSPEINFNKSQTVLNNIHNLSFYYAEQSDGLPKDRTAYNDVNDIFKHIMRLKLHRELNTEHKELIDTLSCSERQSFCGFSGSQIIGENGSADDVLVGGGNMVGVQQNDLDVAAKAKPCVAALLEEDDDLFTFIKLPEKATIKSGSGGVRLFDCDTSAANNVLDPPTNEINAVGKMAPAQHAATASTSQNHLKPHSFEIGTALAKHQASLEWPFTATIPKITFGGFATGRGANIKVSKMALKKSAKIFADVDLELGNATVVDDTNLPLNICDFNLKLQEMPMAGIDVHAVAKNDFGGFSTGRGKEIRVSEAALKKSRQLYDDVSKMDRYADLSSMDADPDYNFLKPAVINDQKNSMKNGQSLAHPEPPENAETICGKLPLATMSPTLLGGFSTGRGQAIKISEENLKKSANLFDDIRDWATASPAVETPVAKKKGTSQLPGSSKNIEKTRTSQTFTHTVRTPVNHTDLLLSITQEVRASTKALLEDEILTEIGEEHLQSLFSNEYSPKQSGRMSKQHAKPTRLSSRFDTHDPNEDVQPCASLPTTRIEVQISIEVRAARKLAIQKQLANSSALKTNVKSCPGTLYLHKVIANKQHWLDFVEHEKPQAPKQGPLLAPNILQLTVDNVADFKLNMFDHLPRQFCLENDDGIRVSDDILVHMNEHCEIGFAEMAAAFLNCPYVDPGLLHANWPLHHLKMIVLKLSSMERSFPDRFGRRIVNLENIMQQLKYRYDWEIDQAKRPVLRKCLEMDDVPSKRMVLFVSKIIGNGMCELCDGFYSVPTAIDSSLVKAINDKRIRIGTKLIVQGAEMLGLDEGCSPFEIPSTVKLKIHGNSSRRVRWHTKLGVYKRATPFLISLNSVLHNGGLIARLAVCIVRVYAMVYVDKGRPNGSTALRSERVQYRIEAQDQKQHELIERLYSQVSKEVNAEHSRNNRPLRSQTKRRIAAISDPSELYELIQFANDPEAIEMEMSGTQKRLVYAYQSKQNDLKSDLINRRVREKLNTDSNGKRKVMPLLKVKVVDANQTDKTAMLSIWSPAESLLELLQERAVVEVFNATACGQRFDELQLSAGRRSTFKKLAAPSSHNGSRSGGHHRRITNILEVYGKGFRPTFNEFDTVGLVVHIGAAAIATNKFQPVYIADDQRNILCINFWAGLESFAYDDLVKVGKVLAIRDLQWPATSNAPHRIPCSFAKEFTIITEHPKSSAMIGALTSLKACLKVCSVSTYVAECSEFIERAVLAQNSTPLRSILGRSKTFAVSLQTPRSSNELKSINSSPVVTPSPSTCLPVSTVQSRIDKLNFYGQPPDISPLAYNQCVAATRRGYKMPRVDENRNGPGDCS